VARVSKSLYDNIDVENLFNQWHPDVRNFVRNLNEDCVLDVIKNTKESIYETSKFEEVLNFTNTVKCREILERALTEKSSTNFINIVKERDILYPREIERGYSIEEIYELVKNNTYHPLLFLELNKKDYIIDGRTRFYCCIFLNIPTRIKIVYDHSLVKTCKNR